MFQDVGVIEKVLNALAEQLEIEGVKNLELLVCGGAALNVAGYVHRTTLDIDVVAYVIGSLDVLASVEKGQREEVRLEKASPLKPEIINAAERVKKDFNLPMNWLNAQVAMILDFGLPDGLIERVDTRSYGKNLKVHFLGRYDQIHFKLYAALISERRIVHISDLIALKPEARELLKAGHWIISCSASYKHAVRELLIQLGYKDVAEKL